MSDPKPVSDTNLLEPTHPHDVLSGRNEIVVATMHYGYKRMILEKDIAVRLRDGTEIYVNVFRLLGEGRFPVVVSFDVYGKDSIHVAAAMPAGGPIRSGNTTPRCSPPGKHLIQGSGYPTVMLW